MQRRSALSRLFWGPISSTVATVGLAIFGLMEGMDRPWPIIVVAASFIVVHSLVNSISTDNIATRLGKQYDDVQRRSVQVIADLGQLAGDHFGTWIVDLYLCRSKWQLSFRWPLVEHKRELSRQLSVSLLEVSEEPSIVSLTDGIHGECFKTKSAQVWLNDNGIQGENVESDVSSGNRQYVPNDAELTEMSTQYGVLNVAPIEDQLKRNCLGVLAVHVKAGREELLRARGVILSTEGRRRIHNACVDLHGMLSR